MGKRREAESMQMVPPLQAGVLPYRYRSDGLLQVLLVTNHAGGWIVPKGQIDPDRTPEEAAQVEALEEAGVVGTPEGPALGHYDYEKFGRTLRVRLFAMKVERVLETWLEMDERRREWVSVDEAIRRVAFPGLRDVLGEFERRMMAG